MHSNNSRAAVVRRRSSSLQWERAGKSALRKEGGNNMVHKLAMVVFNLALAANCLAQDGGSSAPTTSKGGRLMLNRSISRRARQSNVSFASADQSGRK